MSRKRVDNLASVLVTGRTEYVIAMDRVMRASGHVSRTRLLEAALAEYAAKRGFTMPVRLESDGRYSHPECE
jgi:hypothetical protein